MPDNYYIDMDGVLAVYDRESYTGDDPVWLRKSEHYFLNRPPDFAMLNLAYGLYCRCVETGGNVYVLTSLPMNGSVFNEQVHDKQNWLQKWMPFIDTAHTLFCVTSKRDAVEYINNHKLSKHDILIDDYNKNLIEWKAAGGTSVKYCNTINNPNSFSGLKLHHNMSLENMLNILENIAYSAEREDTDVS